MRKIGIFIAVFAMAVVAAVPAFAVVVPIETKTYNLDIISTPTIGSGILGTVTLSQYSLDEVYVAVTLVDDTGFVRTGGPHHAFSYTLDMNPSEYSVSYLYPSNMFTAVSDITNTPFGSFTEGFNCTGCGNGGSSPYYDTLYFSIYSASGISISDFVANSLGYVFAADVIGPEGGTGNIAAGPEAVAPLPPALLIFASGLAGLGSLSGFKKRRNAQK